MSNKKYLPVISIVGRPNVGKSSLFNSISGRRISIVDEISGVTRDRVVFDVTNYEKHFRLIDTGGIVFDFDDFFQEKITQQAEIAIEESDVLIFLLDGKEGLTPLDRDIALLLRKSGKTVYLAVNKVDNEKAELSLGEYYELGFEKVYGVSALHARNIDVLIDDFLEIIPDVKIQDVTCLKMAIVGRPNVGKSTLVNKILNEERVIVSNIPGTTRDSIDIHFKRHEKDFMIIDTAGMRYQRKVRGTIDYYSVNRAQKSIEKADIVLMVIDGKEGLTTLEVKILEKIKTANKPCVLVVNKWDLLPGTHQKEYVESFMDRLAVYSYIPFVFVSALEGKNIHKIFETIDAVLIENTKRIPTPVINRFFEDILNTTPPSIKKGKRFKIYYSCQIEGAVPTFLISSNYGSLLDASYKRFLENKMREKFGFVGAPIVFKIREKTREKED